jgi:hypothetical protein
MAFSKLHRILATATFGFTACLALGVAPAEALTIGASDTGWYPDNGIHDPSNTNYINGNSGFKNYRSFFYFDLSGLIPAGLQIESAKLYAYSYTVTSDNQLATLYDYVGDKASLLDGTGGVGAYDDLGSGTSYGSRIFNAADSNTFKAYTLNFNAITALNAASSGTFVIGARNSTVAPNDYVYGFSGGDPSGDVYLDVKLTPGPLPILGAAATFGYSRKLRRRIHASRSSGVRTTF